MTQHNLQCSHYNPNESNGCAVMGEAHGCAGSPRMGYMNSSEGSPNPYPLKRKAPKCGERMSERGGK